MEQVPQAFGFASPLINAVVVQMLNRVHSSLPLFATLRIAVHQAVGAHFLNCAFFRSFVFSVIKCRNCSYVRELLFAIIS